MTLNLRMGALSLVCCTVLLGGVAAQTTVTAPPAPSTGPADQAPATAVTDAERSAISIVRDDLSLHLIPADGRAEGLAMLTIRNVSASPVPRIPLQLTGSLRWLTVSSVAVGKAVRVPFTQSPVASDTDHLGFLEEAVLTPAQPLAAGASMQVVAFYAGDINQSSARLTTLGAAPDRAAASDWDAIQPTADAGSTALRGFGEVLWYPCGAPLATLGDGNRLFQIVARERRRNTAASMRLRLTVEYAGDPPDSAIFDGQTQPLARNADLDDTLVDETHGVATADFAEQPIGFRTPSLFLTAQHAVATDGQLLSIVSPFAETAEPYSAAAKSVKELLSPWFGETPAQPLTLLDHAGAPFEDGALIVAHLSPNAQPGDVAAALVRGLTHAYLHPAAAADVWLDQGLAELMALLWTEKTQGRAAVIAELQQSSAVLALAEPDTGKPGQPLTEAWSDIYLHRKSAAVLWQLRELLGDDKMRVAVRAFKHSLALNPSIEDDPAAFEKSLERSTGGDLAWFFADWVYHDRGLPDLSIVHATARAELTAKSAVSGYLVAVEARNDGDAIADVPVIVRGAGASIEDRLRIPPHATATVRIFFQGTAPDTVQVNDGSVPEIGSTVHTVSVTTP